MDDHDVYSIGDYPEDDDIYYPNEVHKPYIFFGGGEYCRDRRVNRLLQDHKTSYIQFSFLTQKKVDI